MKSARARPPDFASLRSQKASFSFQTHVAGKPCLLEVTACAACIMPRVNANWTRCTADWCTTTAREKHTQTKSVAAPAAWVRGSHISAARAVRQVSQAHKSQRVGKSFRDVSRPLQQLSSRQQTSKPGDGSTRPWALKANRGTNSKNTQDNRRPTLA